MALSPKDIAGVNIVTLHFPNATVRQETVRREETPEVPQGQDKGHRYRTETLF